MGRITIVGAQDGLAGRIQAALQPSAHATTVARSVHERPAGADVVIVAGTSPGSVREAVEATDGDGCHLVLGATDPATVRWIIDTRAGPAERRGRRIVPAASVAGLPGDLVGAVASGAVDRPDQVHVAYVVPGPGGLAARLPADTRRTLASRLHEPALAYDEGRLVEEATAQERRLAWFPRPLGPRHVVGVPGAEPLTLPRAIAQVSTVRSYLAMPTWQAEVLQLVAASARWRAARRALEGIAGLPPGGRPSHARWGCVAEAHRGEEVARAWVYGRDLVAVSAVGMALSAERVLDGRLPAGVLGAAQLGAPDDLLDELSARSDTRWAVRRPTAEA